MDTFALVVGASWTFTGMLCAALSIPLARRRVGRNAVYGIRFPQSMASDDAWYAINEFGGKRMLFWSVPLMTTGIVAFFLPLKSHVFVCLFIAAILPALFLFVPVIEAWRFAQRYRSKA